MTSVRLATVALAALLAAGCGAGPYAPHFASLSLRVGVGGGEARRVLEAPVAAVLVGHIASVEVRLQDTALAPETATLAVLQSFNVATSTVTFTNLEQGHRYKVWCKARGIDPNGADPGDPTADLTDPDADASTAYIDVPLASSTTSQNVAANLVDALGSPLADGKLPLRLYSPTYRGFGNAGVSVTNGGATNSTHDVIAH